MKNGLSLVLFVVLTLTIAVNSYAQEYTLTTTVGNTTSSKSTIDLLALNGNPNAIIVATQIGTLNPNPIGAWYYNNQWNIFNITHAVMPIGATFKVQYFVQPDANHFLHIITTGSLAAVPRSYLDYPVLNNQPNAQFKIFQNHSSLYTRNPSEAKAEYEAGSGKWFIENVNGTALSRNTAYNIVIASSLIGSNPNTNTPVAEATPKNLTPSSPGSTTPTGNAGGDLNGTYPNPKVIGLLGRPLSTVAPTVGQLLRYNGNQAQWEAVTINSGTTFTPGLGLSFNTTVLNATNSIPMWNASHLVGRKIMTTPPSVGQVLKWSGSSWYPANDEIGISGGDTARFNAGAGLSLNGTTFSAQNTAPMWNANQIAGGKISTTAPTAGQVLKWNGTEWAPAKDEATASTAAKPSVKFFTQNGGVKIDDPNVDTKPIVGLDNQTFELEQDSRIVFTTVIEAFCFDENLIKNTDVKLRVEILNTSNAPVAWSTSSTILFHNVIQGINSTGIGLLPKGKYHTKVTLVRQAGGAKVTVLWAGDNIPKLQGSHLIIEIFPN